MVSPTVALNKTSEHYKKSTSTLSLGGHVGGGGSEGSHMSQSSCRLGKSKARGLGLKLQ